MCQVGASGTAKPPRALAPPLLWGLKSPGRRGIGMEQVPRWPSPPPAPQVTLALSPRCAHSCCPMAAPAAWGAAPAPPTGQALLSASEQLINYLSLGAFNSLGSPGTAQVCWCQPPQPCQPGCGTGGDRRGQAAPLSPASSLRCCPAHPPQGNQTLGIFWSFVVKLFPNSNRFKCHHTNGREKPFMQLQSGFLRWLGY